MFTFHNINSRIYCKKTNTLSTMGSETNQLSGKMIVVRDQAIIGEKLIKDFIKPGDCRLMFDQQDLRHILYNYKQLGFMDINDIHFDKFENSAESFLKNRNESDILVIILIKGGDKRVIMDRLGRSSLSNRGIMCFYAHSNTLSQSTSLRIYFFDKSSRQTDTSWRDRLTKAAEEVRSNTQVESFVL